MILSTKARELHAAALALTNAVDACVIRADGSGTPPATSAELEALKDAAARAWVAYYAAKAEQSCPTAGANSGGDSR